MCSMFKSFKRPTYELTSYCVTSEIFCFRFNININYASFFFFFRHCLDNVRFLECLIVCSFILFLADQAVWKGDFCLQKRCLRVFEGWGNVKNAKYINCTSCMQCVSAQYVLLFHYYFKSIIKIIMHGIFTHKLFFKKWVFWLWVTWLWERSI